MSPPHPTTHIFWCAGAEIEEDISTEKNELRRVFDKHAVEGHVVKDEVIALCEDLLRPLKSWELEASWRSLDPEDHGYVVRVD